MRTLAASSFESFQHFRFTAERAAKLLRRFPKVPGAAEDHWETFRDEFQASGGIELAQALRLVKSDLGAP